MYLIKLLPPNIYIKTQIFEVVPDYYRMYSIMAKISDLVSYDFLNSYHQCYALHMR